MPDRESEGYGLTEAALNRCLKEKGPSLLITVDCGTNSADEVAQAMDAGVDVIVTDHHEPGHTLAEPLALINPRLGQDVTQHVLAGVGVAFKVCHGLVKSGRTNNRPEVADLDLRRFLDIVAIGTVADMVPLLYDNRIFVRHGLSRCEASEWKGLRALIRKSDLTPPFESWHIGYMIGPRLNAAGRLGTAITSLALMLEDDTGEAMKRASELDLANTERRKIEQKMVEQAVKVLDERFDPLNDFSVVVASQTWHPGVIGIVASRLTKRYNRPSMVVAFDENGVGRGSCRGVEGFHLLDALDYCDDLLDTYGGHAMAAGLTVQREQYDTLKDMFNEACTFGLEGVDLRPALRLEGWLDPQEADMTFVRSMDACRPFGMANPQPVWGLKDLSIVGEVKTVGNGHLKLNLACGASEWEAIGFNMADRDIPDGPIDVAATLNVNAFQGRETLQLKLQDFRPAQ
jgi:single-stranded-DNA-specific exonuclease